MTRIVVGISIAAILGLLVLYAQTRVRRGYHRLGKWELILAWRVHVNNSTNPFVLDYHEDYRQAIGYVHHVKSEGHWTAACFLSWTWEVYRGTDLRWQGHPHIHSMQGKCR